MYPLPEDAVMKANAYHWLYSSFLNLPSCETTPSCWETQSQDDIEETLAHYPWFQFLLSLLCLLPIKTILDVTSEASLPHEEELFPRVWGLLTSIP